jgi:lipoprotein signal peptidase
MHLALVNFAALGTLTWWAIRSQRRLDMPRVIFGGLAASGIAGNSLDRLALGYVRDFLVSSLWPIWVFNLADVFILLGLTSLLVMKVFRGPCTNYMYN